MTKAELVSEIAKKTNVTKKRSRGGSQVPNGIRPAGSKKRWANKVRRARHL